MIQTYRCLRVGDGLTMDTGFMPNIFQAFQQGDIHYLNAGVVEETDMGYLVSVDATQAEHTAIQQLDGVEVV